MFGSVFKECFVKPIISGGRKLMLENLKNNIKWGVEDGAGFEI